MRMCVELQVILLHKHADPPAEVVLRVTLGSVRRRIKKDFRIKALRRLCKGNKSARGDEKRCDDDPDIKVLTRTPGTLDV